MLAMVPAMVAMTLVITLVFVFYNRPTHHGTAALAENMARYHNVALDHVTDPISGDTTVRALSTAAVELGALKSIADWRSEIIEIPSGRRYLVTYPADFPDGNARFGARDFAEIPFILRRNDYTAAIFGPWSDSIGLTPDIDITTASLPSQTSPGVFPPIADSIDNLTPMLMTRVE